MADRILYQIFLYFRSFLFVLTIIVSIVSVAKFIKIKWRFVSLAMKLPGPRAYPLVGNALKFACKSDELLERIIDVIMPYVDQTPMRLWMGPELYIVVTEPRDIEAILNNQQATSKGYVYKFLYPFIGNGLISGSGKTWKSHRKLISRIMNQRLFDSFVEVFNRRSKELVDKLIPLSNGKIFDILAYMEGCTIDIVCETIMGYTNMNALNNPNHEFLYHTAEMYRIIHDRMMKVWLHPDWIFRMTSHYFNQQYAQKVIHNFTDSCIKERSQQMNEEKVRTSVLQRLLEVNNETNELNFEELRDEIYTIYIASQDTLAVTSSFALLMLGIHKNVQNKARIEVDEVLNNGTITPESLSKLKYIEMVIKETLRLFPIAPLMVRRLNEELQLESYVLPRACQVVLAPYVTHRSPKYWKMPDQFIPERFIIDEIPATHCYSFIPFSGGPMGCIGKKYAMMCLKILLANVIKKYIVESNSMFEEIRLKTDISIRSIDGYKVSLKLRDTAK